MVAQEVEGWQPQFLRDLLHAPHRQIPFAPLHAAHVGTVDTKDVSKVSLGEFSFSDRGFDRSDCLTFDIVDSDDLVLRSQFATYPDSALSLDRRLYARLISRKI